MNKLKRELLFTGQLMDEEEPSKGGRQIRVYGIVRFLCRFR